MNELLRKHQIIKEIFLYGIIGGFSALSDSGMYYVFTRFFNWNEFISNFISINIGITLSFFLNTFFNFKKTDKFAKRAISFYSVGYVGLVLSMFILYIGVHVFNIEDMIIKLISVFIVAAFQFVLNKLITYGRIN